jgi:hypothetical protein
MNESLDDLASRRPGIAADGRDRAGGPTGGSAAPCRKPAGAAPQPVRIVNGRAFYRNDDVWTDSTAQSRKDVKRVEVAFGSDEYFALLKEHAAAAPWLSLGDQVDVVLGDTLFVVR